MDSHMRLVAVPAALLFVGLTSPASAVAPCPDLCHFAQGQPLLLETAKQIWVRRCDTPTGGVEVCVAQRVDLLGKVLAEKPAPTRNDRDFEKSELTGQAIVRLDWQSAWTDLAKPYVLKLAGRKVKLGIEKDTVVCSPPSLPPARRPLGCTPKAMRVFAAVTHS